MKVALISFHTFYQPGGVKRHVLGLAEEFRKRGIEVKIIAPRRKRKEYYGKNVILLGTSFPFPFSGTTSDLTVNFNPLSIENTLKREKFDVLHFHNFGIPSVLQILSSPPVSETLTVLTFHASLGGSKFMKRFPVVLSLINKICQWKIDGIIGVAPFLLKYFKEYSEPKKAIPNGIDLKTFNPKVQKIKKYSDNKINILFLGRIEKRKGLIYLLRAYRILEEKLGNEWVSSNLRLIIGGQGPLKEDLEKWVRNNKLKNVIFEGEIKHEKAPSYYASCDIFCSPAIFGESFGLVLVEAMACGKPVVAFANEGYRGVLENTKGERFLVKLRDYKALAEKLETLIKNEKLRKGMGQWGIKEAQKYSWQKVASQVLDFYQFCKNEKQKMR